MRVSCDSVSNKHWCFNHVEYNYILKVLDTTASRDLLRIRERSTASQLVYLANQQLCT